MFQGVYNSPYNESVADFGAKRVLGMSGSLTNYINTGNAGTGKAADKDTFEKQQMAKKNKTDKAITAVTVLTLAAAATAGIVAGVKSGKINLSELPAKLKSGFTDAVAKVKSAFTKKSADKAEKSGETLFSKLKSKFAKKTTDKAEKSGETFFSKLKSKFDKKAETAVTNAVDKEALQEYIDYNSVAKPTKVDLEELDELYRANL